MLAVAVNYKDVISFRLAHPILKMVGTYVAKCCIYKHHMQTYYTANTISIYGVTIYAVWIIISLYV